MEKNKALKEVVGQICAMLENNVLKGNQSERFKDWCECGDVFENLTTKHLDVMRKLSPIVDELTDKIDRIIQLDNPNENKIDSYKVYVVNDSYLEDIYTCGDLDEFTEAVGIDTIFDSQTFDTLSQAESFIEGVFNGCYDERDYLPMGRFVLKSWDETDRSYIEVLKNI